MANKKKHKWIKSAILLIPFYCICAVLVNAPVFKPTICTAEENEEPPEFSFQGFVEIENFHNTNKDQSFKDSIKKNELRGRFEIRYGTENLYLFAVPDIYLSSTLVNREIGEDYNYSADTDIARNMKISSSSWEASFNELYLNWSAEKFRVRIGNQLYGWGTADVFNPTSYFNSYDMREMFFKDDDEYKEGVPSFSAMIFFEDYTLETVFSPLQIPGRIPENGDYWRISLDNYQLPIKFAAPRGLDADLSNTALGARLSTSIINSDISFSIYHGPDTDLLFLPVRTIAEEGSPVTVLIEPKSYIVSKIGMDYSMAIDKFVVQFETAYSPDKRGVVAQPSDDIGGLEFPFQVKKSGHISYTAGLNYFIPLYNIIEGHEGETVFTVEWFQSRYFRKNISDPLLTGILTCRFEDQYLESRLSVSISGIFDTEKGGYALWPRLGYDFQNGFSTEVSYVHIDGKSDTINTTESLFYYLKDNDTLIWKVKYDF